jgi:hypothetical protein
LCLNSIYLLAYFFSILAHLLFCLRSLGYVRNDVFLASCTPYIDKFETFSQNSFVDLLHRGLEWLRPVMRPEETSLTVLFEPVHFVLRIAQHHAPLRFDLIVLAFVRWEPKSDVSSLRNISQHTLNLVKWLIPNLFHMIFPVVNKLFRFIIGDIRRPYHDSHHCIFSVFVKWGIRKNIDIEYYSLFDLFFDKNREDTVMGIVIWTSDIAYYKPK